MRRWSGWRAACSALHTDSHGQAFVLAALMLTVLLGFTGLALDMGATYVQYSEAQNAADSAALAGADDLPNQSANAVADANTIAATTNHPSDGFVDGQNGTTVKPKVLT